MNALAIILSCLFALTVAQGPDPYGRYGDCRHTPIEDLVKIDQVHRPENPDKALRHIVS